MKIKNRTIMAKAILEYDLNDPDDSMAHRRAIKSTDMAIVLHELDYNIHRRIEDGIDADKYKTLEEVADAYRTAIMELFNEQGINLDELIR
jgi:hypothetical protein